MATVPPEGIVGGVVEERAISALRHSPYLAVQGITCRCEGNALILEGEVPTYYQKQNAQETVAHLPEMPPIVNRIHVRAY